MNITLPHRSYLPTPPTFHNPPLWAYQATLTQTASLAFDTSLWCPAHTHIAALACIYSSNEDTHTTYVSWLVVSVAVTEHCSKVIDALLPWVIKVVLKVPFNSSHIHRTLNHREIILWWMTYCQRVSKYPTVCERSELTGRFSATGSTGLWNGQANWCLHKTLNTLLSRYWSWLVCLPCLLSETSVTFTFGDYGMSEVSDHLWANTTTLSLMIAYTHGFPPTQTRHVIKPY